MTLETTPMTPEPAPPAPRRRLGLKFLIAAGAILALGGGTLYYLRAIAPFESTDDAFVDGHVIAVNPQVSGLVASVHFDDNQVVRKGDLLVEIDPVDLQVALRQAQGAEAAARGRLDEARAAVNATESAVNQARAAQDSAQATFDNADRELKRQQGLDERARTLKDLDAAIANRKTAAAALAAAAAQLESAKAQVASAQASVTAAEGDFAKAQADTQRAQVNLGYTRIVAPADGRITRKTVEPGSYVTPTGSLFTIVPKEVWITANFKETQLGQMRPGQPVEVTVDAYPRLKLSGRVDSIQSGTGSRFSVLPAENATGNFVKTVQRVPVKITLEAVAGAPWASLLAPGLSVLPKVRVER
jgi:membrane fusion protein (multidrug efflux system)